MTERLKPERWANRISRVLNDVLGPDRFPVKVEEVALEFSHQYSPEDPITTVTGDDLPGFEGALVRGAVAKKGWGIFYNNAIASRGRINFTLGHEFGHYLLHRQDYPRGITCGENDMVRWDSEYGQIEHQANIFAATLLMPLDDFRRQIGFEDRPGFDALGEVANRYDVSLIAATLRWLEYTARRAVLVVSREGFILWSRSTRHALRTGAFFRTAGCSPIEVPTSSLAATLDAQQQAKASRELDQGTWFREEPCEEFALASDRYDFTVSLLHLESTVSFGAREEDAEEEIDLVDQLRRHGSLKLR